MRGGRARTVVPPWPRVARARARRATLLLAARAAAAAARACLRRVEDNVELAHILEVAVERLDEHLHEVEDAELRLRVVDHHAKVQRRILPVDDAHARLKPLGRIDERRGCLGSRGERSKQLADDLLLLLLRLRTRRAHMRPRGITEARRGRTRLLRQWH
jgi:hypothetical protein